MAVTFSPATGFPWVHGHALDKGLVLVGVGRVARRWLLQAGSRRRLGRLIARRPFLGPRGGDQRERGRGCQEDRSRGQHAPSRPGRQSHAGVAPPVQQAPHAVLHFPLYVEQPDRHVDAESIATADRQLKQRVGVVGRPDYTQDPVVADLFPAAGQLAVQEVDEWMRPVDDGRQPLQDHHPRIAAGDMRAFHAGERRGCGSG